MKPPKSGCVSTSHVSCIECLQLLRLCIAVFWWSEVRRGRVRRRVNGAFIGVLYNTEYNEKRADDLHELIV